MVKALSLPDGLQGPQDPAMRLPASQGFRVRYTATGVRLDEGLRRRRL